VSPFQRPVGIYCILTKQLYAVSRMKHPVEKMQNF